MTFGPNINVWTLGKGARGQWKLQLSTADLGEAAACFKALEQAGKQVALYELGLFEHEGHRIAGQVAFWWSANLNAFMEREPEDRGVGWADGYDTYVTYTVPEAAPTASLPAAVEEPRERYVERGCDHCGKIVPMNALSRFTHEVRTGRTSGTSRVSRSTSSRSSSNSYSSGARYGSSSTSGRTHYRTETLLLCNDCYARQKHASRNIFQIVWDLLNKS